MTVGRSIHELAQVALGSPPEASVGLGFAMLAPRELNRGGRWRTRVNGYGMGTGSVHQASTARSTNHDVQGGAWLTLGVVPFSVVVKRDFGRDL